MASVVERTTKAGERRLFVVFHATDRTTGKRRKHWELQASALKKDANARKAAVEVALRASRGVWPAEVEQAKPLTFAEYRDQWLADRARKVSERVLENDRRTFRLYLA